MRILAADSSSKSASCAITCDGALLGESFTNVGLTHSQTIMPMIDTLLEQTHLRMDELDLLAVTNGPGSFTGLRIGIATIKGMAHAQGLPCAAVSTLEALAYNLCAVSGYIIPVLDARRAQVYTATFVSAPNHPPKRLCDDRACSLSELSQEIEKLETAVFLVGDGAQMCYTELSKRHPNLILAPASVRYVRASSVALAAQETVAHTAAELLPQYLRLSQAERELQQKNSNNLEESK